LRTVSLERTTHPVLIFWIIAGWVGYCLLPWYGVEGFWEFEWLVDGWPLDEDYAPAAVLIAMGQKLWLAPMLLALAAPLLVLGRRKTDPLYARVLVLSGAFGFSWLVAQGLGIGLRGFTADWLTALFGPLRGPAVRHGLWRDDHRVVLSVPVHPRHCRARGGERRCLCHRSHRRGDRGRHRLCLLPHPHHDAGGLCHR
jgi:hypothetical protein